MTTSLWSLESEIPVYPRLNTGEDADVCVIGTGIAGLTAAYLLTKAGKDVVVVSASTLGGGESSGTTAQINTVHDDSWTEMLRIHGEEKVRLCYNGYREALDFIRSTIAEERIECGFEIVPAFLFQAPGTGGDKWIKEEYDAARTAGVEDVEMISGVPAGTFSNQSALRYGGQGQFNPLRYLVGLADCITKRSGRIYTGTLVTGVQSDPSCCTVKLSNGREITADGVVMASNVPMHHKLIPIEALAAYRSYVIQVAIDHRTLPPAQYWDNADPYHYVRMVGAAAEADGCESLLVGGEDHRVGETKDAEAHFKRLEEWARQKIPGIKRIQNRWSAQTIETFDGMPLIGHCGNDVDNILIITGDSGTGMTHGTLGGIIASGQLQQRNHYLADLFDPKRARTRSLKRWIGENVKSISQYQDWTTPGEVSDVQDITPGNGAVVRKGLQKVAVYRDTHGQLHEMSATCPHLGGLVRWNSVEHSWDCPVHGSRFTCTGGLLNGPACASLRPEDADEPGLEPEGLAEIKP